MVDDTEYIMSWKYEIFWDLGTATVLVNYPGSSRRNQSMVFSMSQIVWLISGHAHLLPLVRGRFLLTT